MSAYAAKVARIAEFDAHVHQWTILFWISLYWAVGYFLFFLWMGIVEYNRGLNKIPHSWGILWAGLVGTFAMMFFALLRFLYWSNCRADFLGYFR